MPVASTRLIAGSSLRDHPAMARRDTMVTAWGADHFTFSQNPRSSYLGGTGTLEGSTKYDY
jgi:hypothetical protein